MQPIVTWKNRQVIVDQTSLVANALEITTLGADIASGSSTLTVANIDGYGVNQILILNPFNEKAEIIKTHASSAPSGTTITLAANTVFAHSTGEKVIRIEFDQVEISWASTVAGSKTTLTTSNLQADQPAFIYLETTKTAVYYFARFKESIGSTFGSYSDPILQGTGWLKNTVGYMIDRALQDLSQSLTTKVTLQDCYAWINECLDEVQGKLLHWPEHYTYNYIAGQVSRGINTITMPSDAYDTETNKSVLSFRIGTGRNLIYLTPVEFDAQLDTVAETTSRTQAAVGATSLTLTNSYDFADSGSIHVYISGTQYSITYTGVTRDTSSGGTAALTGVPASGTGSITVIIPAGTNVWQNETEATPTYFTVRNGSLEWWPLADSAHDAANAFLDYSHVATAVDSDGDTIDLQRYLIVQRYLTWRMEGKAKKDGVQERGTIFRGRFIPTGYYAAYTDALDDAIKTTATNNKFPQRPAVNRMRRYWTRAQKPSIQDISITDQ